MASCSILKLHRIIKKQKKINWKLFEKLKQPTTLNTLNTLSLEIPRRDILNRLYTGVYTLCSSRKTVSNFLLID